MARKTTTSLSTTTFTADTTNLGYSFDGREYYYAGGRTKTEVSDFTENDERWHYHVGNYYSHKLAKLGYIYYSYGITTEYTYNPSTGNYTSRKTTDYLRKEDSRNSMYSVCPKGWSLPTNKEIVKLGNTPGEKYAVYGGYLKDDSVITDEEIESRYISNSAYYTDYNSYTYQYTFTYKFNGNYIEYTSSNVTNSSPKTAFSVRCIARKDIDINNPFGARVADR